MTAAAIILILVVLGLVGWALLEFGLPVRGRRHDEQTMPMELATAELWCSEKLFRCDSPVPLTFKPDRVYKSTAGMLIVEETKTHDRVYLSDIVQLSVSATGLRVSAGLPVAPYGYVRLVTSQGKRTSFKKVRLLSDREVIRLHHRRLGVLSGEISPAKSCQAGLCRGCAYQDVC